MTLIQAEEIRFLPAMKQEFHLDIHTSVFNFKATCGPLNMSAAPNPKLQLTSLTACFHKVTQNKSNSILLFSVCESVFPEMDKLPATGLSVILNDLTQKGYSFKKKKRREA